MKKLFAFIAVIGILGFGVSNIVSAQAEEEAASDTMEAVSDSIVAEAATPMDEASADTEAEDEEEVPLHTRVKAKFIEGGATFMGIVLLCLIIGLALAIERIIYLNMATTNTDKLLAKIEDALNEGGVEAAKEVCRNTSGPVASIFYQGLDRSDEGLEMVEKSIISYGSVQMGLMEKNLSWISLFIALAPMLGFMGTVIGMISAFDNIREAGNVSPQIVAGGIGIALLTTLFGLIVAAVLQVFYNYILSKIDSIVNRMEDASISMVDLLIKYNQKK